MEIDYTTYVLPRHALNGYQPDFIKPTHPKSDQPPESNGSTFTKVAEDVTAKITKNVTTKVAKTVTTKITTTVTTEKVRFSNGLGNNEGEGDVLGNNKFKKGLLKSQFAVENEIRKNPAAFRLKGNATCRNRNKLNRSGFTSTEVAVSVIDPGVYFREVYECEEKSYDPLHLYPFPNVTTFEECMFEGETLSLIQKRGLTEMTAIQKFAIPMLLERANYSRYDYGLMIRAPAGSGKTLAVIIPIVSRIFHLKAKYPGRKGPYALFVAHNNISCAQICKELLALCPEGCGIKVGMSCGSQDPKVINRLLEEGVDILVATSGRADNHFFKSAEGSVHELQIDLLRYLVVDEADTFVSSYNYAHYIEPILSKLKAKNKAVKLILLTSCYKDLKEFSYLLPKDFKVSFLSVGRETLPNTIKLRAFDVAREHKHKKLLSILHDPIYRDYPSQPPKCIVFVKENDRCARLATRLHNDGFLAIDVCSQDSPQQYLRRVKGFLAGVYDIMVAQDMLARSINVPNLKMVIHYDLCDDSNHHNILSSCGRVGRLGNVGFCTVFYDRREDGIACDVFKSLQYRMELSEGMKSTLISWDKHGVRGNWEKK
ncbi:unnamed protein product [Bursaphelenchus okinawaensis]|uniref:ATP-dependent RNA helicase n=1 Tax=Bursaphelenchus okinawaensis TaxID=465554 RepID=A0A811K648_9BILA|nr:unnamed protein product [Bursaphelenchus okinawaensis]CAG9092869.1 unnamed protein product [Bursaphelenchus okinawaensis]